MEHLGFVAEVLTEVEMADALDKGVAVVVG